MKVGIVTYHRALNYGAVLQAVALRTVLEKLGYDAFFFNYWPSYHESKYAVFSWYKLRGYSFMDKVFYCRESWRMAKPRLERKRHFKSFFRKHVTPYCVSASNRSMDVAVYGSDQIWRRQVETGVYNPVYFGASLINARKKISYAASMGLLPDNNIDIEILREMLSNMDRISVREQDLSSFLSSIGYEDHRVVMDPTLLLSGEQWANLVDIPDLGLGRYILIYGITAISFDWAKLREFAGKRGLKIVHLSGTASNKDNECFFSTVGPEYFLSLIRDAEYVFSSSFHGVAFSVIFRKQFFASFHSNSNRAQTLLDSLGLSDRMICDDVYDIPDIDYNVVQDKLDRLKEDSLSFLSESLN